MCYAILSFSSLSEIKLLGKYYSLVYGGIETNYPFFGVIAVDGYLLQVIEYLIGDGPNNRYALICKQCCSHNGMALKEEFEYTGNLG